MAELSEADFEPSSQGAGDDLSIDDFASGGVTPDSGDAGLQPGQVGTPSQAGGSEPQTLTIRDYLQQNGVQLPGGADNDYAALNYLIAQQREAARLTQAQAQIDAYAQIGRQLAPQADRLIPILQQQQQPAGRKPWEAPPFDERWSGLVNQDPVSGVYIGKPGTSPEIVKAVNDYAEWSKAFNRNPTQVMEQYVSSREEQIIARVQKQFEERLARQETETRTRQIVQENSSWFYAKDAQGNFMRDPISGQAVATPLGQQYIQIVKWADSIGVKDPAAKDQYAKMVLRNELAAAQNPTPATNQATPAQQRALASTTRTTRNPLQALGAQERRETPRATEPDQSSQGLAAMMRQRFREAGVTDDDFATLN